MTCSSCKYLKEGKKSQGACSGCKYYCSKMDSYVNGSDSSCSNYEESYRDNYLCNEIYQDGERYSDDNKSLSFYIFVAIILFIILIIYKIFFEI